MFKKISIESIACGLASLFPKAFCTVIHTWSLYVLVYLTCYQRLSKDYLVLSWILAISGSILYIFSLYTYFMVIVAGPGSPLDFPQLRIRDLELLNLGQDRSAERSTRKDKPLLEDMEQTVGLIALEPDSPPIDYMTVHCTSKKQGRSGFKFCNKCSVWKPDRSHHCSSSGKCILRMDHYCPWFTACIGFRNQKFFIQFLWYSVLYCIVNCVATSLTLWKFLKAELFNVEDLSINLVLLFVISLAFGVALAMFTGLQLYLVLKNLTTIEMSEMNGGGHGSGRFDYQFDYNGERKKLGNIYDLGWRSNLASIMGASWFEILFPVAVTSNDINDLFKNGVNFKVDEEVYNKWVANADLQSQLNDQLRDYNRRT